MGKKETKTCSADGCDKPVVARGLCGTHYSRQRKTDAPSAPRGRGGKRSKNDIAAALAEYIEAKIALAIERRTADLKRLAYQFREMAIQARHELAQEREKRVAEEDARAESGGGKARKR